MAIINGQGPKRATKTYIVKSPLGEYYFSYNTCVAAHVPAVVGEEGQISYRNIRRNNDWGPTTGRHIKEMGVHDWEVLDEQEFDDVVAASFPHQRHPGALILAGRIDKGEIEAGALEKQWAATVLGKAAVDAESGDLWVDLDNGGDKS